MTMDRVVDWSTPPAVLSLPNGVLHIWRARLDVSPDSLAHLAANLSRDEVERAQRFRFARDRQEFIAARGILRLLLGRYLRKPPSRIAILRATHGKPYISAAAGERLRFNVSHSHGVALFAFAHEREVGIDIEKLEDGSATDRLAQRFFSVAERSELRELAAKMRTEAFFHCWTRKEAYVKANGDGLRVPLDGFDVTVTPGQPAKLRAADSLRWSLFSFRPAPEFVAAAVAEGKRWRLRFFDWNESSPAITSRRKELSSART